MSYGLLTPSTMHKWYSRARLSIQFIDNVFNIAYGESLKYRASHS
jgi:hypothetical protein